MTGTSTAPLSGPAADPRYRGPVQRRSAPCCALTGSTVAANSCLIVPVAAAGIGPVRPWTDGGASTGMAAGSDAIAAAAGVGHRRFGGVTAPVPYMVIGR